MVKNSGAQPDMLLRPKSKNSKFGPDSPRDEVKLGPPVVPDHVLHEKQVLRFYGVFSEERPWDSEAALGVPQMETSITRHLTICWFLEDGTISMNEGSAQNGMSGGCFANRAIYQKKDGTDYTIKDLSVGNTIQGRGQDILIYDADKNTREYFRKNLKEIMAPALDVAPKVRQDQGVAFATGGAAGHLPEPMLHEEGNYKQKSAEYEVNKARSDKTREFRKNDTRVLRFESILDSKTANTIADKILNSTNRYAVNYYLADNTMEIKLIRDKRSGFDEVPSLFKRGKLAKNWKEAGQGKQPIYYALADLVCGKSIDCVGRTLTLIDCDSSTRAMYEDWGMLQIPARNTPDIPVHVIPKRGDGFLAIGSEEDALGSVHGQPKPAKDLVKLAKYQGVTLSCSLKLISSKPNDISDERNFTLVFYLEDDTLQINEEVKPNTGRQSKGGGSVFLKRGKYYNELPEDSEVPRYFTPTDFYLGNVFSVHRSEMRIVNLDEKTLSFCESAPLDFPMFDPVAVTLKHIDEIVDSKMDIRNELMKYDRRKNGVLTKELLLHALNDIGLHAAINDQELLTLMRKVKNAEGKYEYDEICDVFSQVYYSKSGSGKLSRSYPVQTNTSPNVLAFLNYIRGNKMLLRSALRADTSMSNYTTFARLDFILKKGGITLTAENKQFIIDSYTVSEKERVMILPQLKFSEKDKLNDSVSRLDIKSVTRVMNTVSSGSASINATPVISDIQRRRMQLSQPVLRPTMSATSPKTQVIASNEDDVELDDSKIVINYRVFCDDIYRCDWC